MKILALDIGSAWVGSALSDYLGISCKPHKTVKLEDLKVFLKDLLHNEPVSHVVVGHPITVAGKISAQTKEIEAQFALLSKEFSEMSGRSVTWLLWDERFSTKRAIEMMSRNKKGRSIDKQKEHSVAAAFILQSYLDSKALHDN